MKEQIFGLIKKYRELIIYFIVGVITTVVNWVTSFLLDGFLFDSSDPVQNTVINVIAWIVAVGVSFPMNRKWVFESKNPEWGKELIGFTGARVSTLLIEELIMLLCVNVFHIPFKISKVFIASVIVMILNYVFSKLLVFKKGQQK